MRKVTPYVYSISTLYILGSIVWMFLNYLNMDVQIMRPNIEKFDDSCKLEPEDEEREYLLSLTTQERKNFPQNSSHLLSDEEWKTLFKLKIKDPLPPKPFKCVDNHKLFNSSIFTELNLFYIYNSLSGPELVRNISSFTLLGLNTKTVNCNYSFMKSNDYSDKDDSEINIHLEEEKVSLINPYNTVGVKCSATYTELKHLLNQSNKKILLKKPKDIITFYYEVLMFIYRKNMSPNTTVNCGGFRATSCSKCELEGGFTECRGECIWVNNKCEKRGGTKMNIPGYSVLILVIDSVSKSSFHRNLPKTLNYLKDKGGIILNKHHKQGGNSYPNVMALLTGNYLRKGIGVTEAGYNHHGTMNSITKKNNLTWAWEYWTNASLPSMYHQDMPWIGLFNSYSRLGWEHGSPFMFDHKTAYRAMDSKAYKIRNGYFGWNAYKCIGNVPSYQRQFDLLSKLAKTYPDVPYFSYMHISELSHDYLNLINNMDDDLFRTFHTLLEGKYLDRTLMIVMGDHGRVHGIPGRAGWVDTNTPMMLMLIPENMKREKLEIMHVVKENGMKITTMQDIYETITDPIITGKKPVNRTESLSLLHPIPKRNCEEAFISYNFCMCPQNVKVLDMADPKLMNYSKGMVAIINQMVMNYNTCLHLELSKVEWGWVDGDVYNIQLFTQKLSGKDGKKLPTFRAVFHEKEWPNVDIERTDRYGETSKCITEKVMDRLKPFCICWNLYDII